MKDYIDVVLINVCFNAIHRKLCTYTCVYNWPVCLPQEAEKCNADYSKKKYLFICVNKSDQPNSS